MGNLDGKSIACMAGAEAGFWAGSKVKRGVAVDGLVALPGLSSRELESRSFLLCSSLLFLSSGASASKVFLFAWARLCEASDPHTDGDLTEG